MQMKRMKLRLSCILCTVFIVAAALVATGCSDKAGQHAVPSESTAAVKSTAAVESTAEVGNSAADKSTAGVGSAVIVDGDVLGDGQTVFDFTVVDQDGNQVACEIHTDRENVGEALQELGLIAGEEGPYGLYVKTVNGITVDYNKDGKYWAFYVGDKYSSSSVDATSITAGESYTFKVE